jgi:outer membrane protein insertion porin family
MNRLSLCIALAMLATSALAQSTPPQPQPQPQPQKPKPGTIIERPNAGGITEGEKPAPPPARPVPGKPTGQVVERFEAVGNTSVASDTIRVYLGVNPGDPYDPDLIQRNFLNLWQTGLFDDIKIETDRGTGGGVVVRAVVKERPRIGSVEYRGNKELNATKIQEALEHE